MKQLAVIGSSGGNLYNQGGSDPNGMMKEIFIQAESAGIEIKYIQFISTKTSMDKISKANLAKANLALNALANLYTLGADKTLVRSGEQELSEINELAKETDRELARLIDAGEIDGIMLMSCDPKGANKEAIKAAARMQIPIAGTGGTSMADTQAAGCRVIAASGTTGTTNRTRAVSAISAFSKEWKLKYSPVIGSSGSGNVQEGNVWKRVNIRGIMMASMPGFIAMALCLALSKIPGLGALDGVFTTLVGILPIIVAAIAAKQISGLDEVGIVAGVVAGAMSVDGGMIGGILVGILAGILVYYISSFCFKHKVPGTTTNIAAGGLSGIIAGLVGMYAIAPIALVIGNGIKFAIDWSLDFPILAGGLAGFVIWFAIIGGVYHAAILPIVLLEMEATGFSFLGAIDLCGLVMVCAGIQLAYIVMPRNQGERATAIPNILINLGFGTFVEAAYPFMFSSKKVFASAIAASTISGIFIGLFDVKCTAYIPFFLAPLMTNDKAAQVILCMIIAFGCAFALTLLSNLSERKKHHNYYSGAII